MRKKSYFQHRKFAELKCVCVTKRLAYKMHGFSGMMGKMDFTALNESAQEIEALSDARGNKDMVILTFQPQSLHGNL